VRRLKMTLEEAKDFHDKWMEETKGRVCWECNKHIEVCNESNCFAAAERKE